MAQFEAKGTIKRVGKIEHIQTKNGELLKRQLVIEEDPNEKGYFDTICVSLLKDKAEESFKSGDRITVRGNIRSREWQGKYFTEVTCWYTKIEGASSGSQPQPNTGWEEEKPRTETSRPEPKRDNFDSEDLPF